jgi:hypothetical protein
MRNIINEIKVYIEVYWYRLLYKLFKYELSTDGIPKDTPYCYLPDIERNENARKNGEYGVYYTKPCTHYRYLKGQLRGGCVYTGIVGDDLLLGDQCKVCGVKDE